MRLDGRRSVWKLLLQGKVCLMLTFVTFVVFIPVLIIVCAHKSLCFLLCSKWMGTWFVKKRRQWNGGVIIHIWLFCLGQDSSAFTLVDTEFHYLTCDLEAAEALMVGACNLHNYGDLQIHDCIFHTLNSKLIDGKLSSNEVDLCLISLDVVSDPRTPKNV